MEMSDYHSVAGIEVNSRWREPQQYLEAIIGEPFTSGNAVQILRNGSEIFPAMLSAIDGAEERILFETYVYWKGQIAIDFANALAKKAADGVDVRVLLDAHGSADMDSSLIDKMREAGADVRLFRPLGKRFWDIDKRTHRKILVCDQRIGFTGGVGIAEEWDTQDDGRGGWRETHFSFRGPAVHGLSGAFWNNWIDVGGETLPDSTVTWSVEQPGDVLVQVIRSSPATHQSEMELVFESLIAVAKKRLILTTPYFNVRPKTIDLLLEKAKQGVAIEILLPGSKIDKSVELLVADECLMPLVEAGITVRRYQPEMIHAKVVRVDDVIACVGSPNFNQRSRKKDFEIATVMMNEKVAAILDKHYEDDVKHAELIEPGELRQPSLPQLLGRKALLLFREQL